MKKNTIFAAVSILFISVLISLIYAWRTPLTLRVELVSPDIDEYYLFYHAASKASTGYPFNQLDSMGVTVSRTEDIVTLDYRLPAKRIQSVRMDPGNRPGPLGMKSISLIQDGKTLNYWDSNGISRDFLPANHIDLFKAEDGVLLINRTGGDPQIVSRDTFGSAYRESYQRANRQSGRIHLYVLVFLLAVFLFLKQNAIMLQLARLPTPYGAQKLHLINALVLLGFSASVIYHYWMAAYLNKPYPVSTFLFDPGDRFNDFIHIYDAVKDLDPYHFAGGFFGNYFPFTYMVMYPLRALSVNTALLTAMGIFILTQVVFLYRMFTYSVKDTLLKLNSIFILTAFSYPVLYEIDRANLESFVFLFLAVFVLFFLKQRYALSALFLASAIAMKGYPVVFAVLFFTVKRYREAFLTILLTLCLSLSSMMALKGGIGSNFNGLTRGLEIFKTHYIVNFNGVPYGNSLYSITKLWKDTSPFLSSVYDHYFLIAVIIFLLIVVYVVFFEDVLWKKFTLLLIMAIILPHVSFDYKLIHLTIPIGLFIATNSRQRSDIMYCMLFGLLLIPKDYFILKGTISIAVIINPMIMILMMGSIMAERLSAVLMPARPATDWKLRSIP